MLKCDSIKLLYNFILCKSGIPEKWDPGSLGGTLPTLGSHLRVPS